jgi:hypothetical protein
MASHNTPQTEEKLVKHVNTTGVPIKSVKDITVVVGYPPIESKKGVALLSQNRQFGWMEFLNESLMTSGLMNFQQLRLTI